MDTIIEMLGGVDVIYPFLATVLGVVAHYIKKIIRDGYDWKTYWKTESKNSYMAISGALLGFATMIQTGGSSLLMYFLLGFSCDSILNKALKKAENVDPFK